MAAKMTEDSFADGVLETLQELGRESGGLVEVEAAGLAFGILVRIGPLKDAVHDAEVIVIVGVEAGGETMEKAVCGARMGVRGARIRKRTSQHEH